MFTFVTICKDTNKIELTKKKMPEQPGNPRRMATSPRASHDPEPTPAARRLSKWLQGGIKAGAWREETIFASARKRRYGKAGNRAARGRARRAVPTGGDRTRPGTAPPGGGKGHTKEERKPPAEREQPRRPPDTQAPKDRDQPTKRPQVFISPAPSGGGGQRGRGHRGFRLGWERRR